MEDSSHLRHWGNLTEFKHSEDEKKNWFLAKLDKMRGLDYKSQEKLVEELYEETLDSEGGQKVYTCTCICIILPVYYLHV